MEKFWPFFCDTMYNKTSTAKQHFICLFYLFNNFGTHTRYKMKTKIKIVSNSTFGRGGFQQKHSTFGRGGFQQKHPERLPPPGRPGLDSDFQNLIMISLSRSKIFIKIRFLSFLAIKLHNDLERLIRVVKYYAAISATSKLLLLCLQLLDYGLLQAFLNF